MAEQPFLPKAQYLASDPSDYDERHGDPGSALQDLIDRMESLISTAMSIPGTNRVLVDRLELLDLIDQMRVMLPDELQDAREILREREDLLADAQRQAEQAATRARQHVESRINESEIVQKAQERAQELVAAAKQEAEERRADADAYALGVLQDLEDRLAGQLKEVRGGIRTLQEDLQLNQSYLDSGDDPDDE